MRITEFLTGLNGDLSSKRLVGITCGLIGIVMHCYLFRYGLSHEIASYKDLAGTANDLLKVATVCLVAGVFEKQKGE